MAGALADGLDKYQMVRFQEARRAGLTNVEALRFAEGQESLRTLRVLKAGGCPPARIAEIVT